MSQPSRGLSVRAETGRAGFSEMLVRRALPCKMAHVLRVVRPETPVLVALVAAPGCPASSPERVERAAHHLLGVPRGRPQAEAVEQAAWNNRSIPCAQKDHLQSRR